MNKTNLLKLKQVRLQLENQLSSILCCKSYIFDSQFNTTDTIDKLHNLDKKIYERPELTTYEPKNTEDILLWFQTDKCKTPSEKLILEHFELNVSHEWFKLVNENKVIQEIFNYSKIFIKPLIHTFFICLIMCIMIYYLFIQTYNIRFPLDSLINIIKNSILLRNNLPKIIFSRIEKTKYIMYIGVIFILLNIATHIYNLHTISVETQILYNKIKTFKRQVQCMRNITEKLCNTPNDTLNYFMNILNNEIYERGGCNSKGFLIMNRGQIISDYFKIANKKNKLGKLFKLNGMFSYMKIMNC